MRSVRLLAENKLSSSSSELLLRDLIEGRQNEEFRIWVKNNYVVLGDIAYAINPSGSLGRTANCSHVCSGKRIRIVFKKKDYIRVPGTRDIQPINLNIILKKTILRINGMGSRHSLATNARIPYDKFSVFSILDEEVRKLWPTTRVLQ